MRDCYTGFRSTLDSCEQVKVCLSQALWPNSFLDILLERFREVLIQFGSHEYALQNGIHVASVPNIFQPNRFNLFRHFLLTLIYEWRYWRARNRLVSGWLNIVFLLGWVGKVSSWFFLGIQVSLSLLGTYLLLGLHSVHSSLHLRVNTWPLLCCAVDFDLIGRGMERYPILKGGEHIRIFQFPGWLTNVLITINALLARCCLILLLTQGFNLLFLLTNGHCMIINGSLRSMSVELRLSCFFSFFADCWCSGYANWLVRRVNAAQTVILLRRRPQKIYQRAQRRLFHQALPMVFLL